MVPGAVAIPARSPCMGSDSATAAITIWWSCDAALDYLPMPRYAWASDGDVDLLMPLLYNLVSHFLGCLQVHLILRLSHRDHGKALPYTALQDSSFTQPYCVLRCKGAVGVLACAACCINYMFLGWLFIAIYQVCPVTAKCIDQLEECGPAQMTQ